MKVVQLSPEQILSVFKIAEKTFGTFDFTFIPSGIQKGEDVTDGPDAEFWISSVFCACFFPKTAKGSAFDSGNAENEVDLENRMNGFAQVCTILQCEPDDEVVAIRPIL